MEELYYPYSENKGADQLRGYRVCFQKAGFLITRLISTSVNTREVKSRTYEPRLENTCFLHTVCENKGANQLISLISLYR